MPLPKTIVCDNGTELTSKAMFFWSEKTGTTLHFIQPGRSSTNGAITITMNAHTAHWATKRHSNMHSKQPDMMYFPSVRVDRYRGEGHYASLLA